MRVGGGPRWSREVWRGLLLKEFFPSLCGARGGRHSLLFLHCEAGVRLRVSGTTQDGAGLGLEPRLLRPCPELFLL